MEIISFKEAESLIRKAIVENENKPFAYYNDGSFAHFDDDFLNDLRSHFANEKTALCILSFPKDDDGTELKVLVLEDSEGWIKCFL
ncbi:MAG: hypothetical protein OEV44_02870 [Spirochaetota bacterium]|nr:hypothetical protein [Spirochaetota bacterium]